MEVEVVGVGSADGCNRLRHLLVHLEGIAYIDALAGDGVRGVERHVDETRSGCERLHLDVRSETIVRQLQVLADPRLCFDEVVNVIGEGNAYTRNLASDEPLVVFVHGQPDGYVIAFHHSGAVACERFCAGIATIGGGLCRGRGCSHQ